MGAMRRKSEEEDAGGGPAAMGDRRRLKFEKDLHRERRRGDFGGDYWRLRGHGRLRSHMHSSAPGLTWRSCIRRRAPSVDVLVP